MLNKRNICIVLLIITVIVITFYYFYNKSEKIIMNQSKNEEIILNTDIYPLYSGVVWSKASSTNEYFNLIGNEISAIAIKDTSNISEISTPFEKYYSEKLKTLGWTIDNSMAAGGPGAEITAYKKGDEYIIIRFDTNFKDTKENEPVQCPCDVTFYVFSGKIKQ